MRWTTAEVNFVASLYALGLPAETVHELHQWENSFPERTLVAIANAKTQRIEVRDRIKELKHLKPASTPEEVSVLERKLTVKEDDLADLKRKLKQAHRSETTFLALADEIAQHVHPISPPNINIKSRTEGSSDPVSLVACLGDIHADAIVNPDSVWGLERYDFDVCCHRMERWLSVNTRYINTYRPGYDFQDIWVFGIGDNVHGDIHDHRHRNHFRNTLKASLATGDLMAEALYELHQKTRLPVTMIGVSGNHPRRSSRKDYGGPQDNFDYLTYVNAAQRLRDVEGINIITPDSWTAFVEVQGRTWSINHGDDVIGYAGHPWYGFDRKNNRVQSAVSQANIRIDYFVYGHYHTPAMATSGSHMSFHNGAFPATDDYALNKISAIKPPMQWTFIQNEKHGIIDMLPIWLQNLEKEKSEPNMGRASAMDLTEALPTPNVGTLSVIR